MAQLRRALLMASFVAATACGSSASDDPTRETRDEAPCWGLVEPLPNPKTHAEHTCNAVIRFGMGNLDATFGPYARGEIPFYAGTVSATDSFGGELSGQGYAQVVRDEYVGLENEGGVLLQIVVPGTNRWLTLGQTDANPETMIVGTVLEWDAWGGALPTASAGEVRLAAAPASLELELEAENADGASSVELHLTKVQPSDIATTAVLEFPNAMIWDYQVADGEFRRVWREGGVSFAADRPKEYTGTGTCGYNPSFSVEQYVELDDVSNYGVRNVVLYDNSLCCGTCQAEHCTADYCEDLGAK